MTTANAPEGDLTLTEAAERLGVHYMTAYRYVRRGLLEAQQRGGQWWVSETALESFRTERRGAARTDARAGRGSRRAPRSRALADRLLAGDQAGAWAIVDDAIIAGAGLPDVYLSLLTQALHAVGDRWEAGEITIADEHRATGVALRLIGRLGALCGRPGRSRGSVLLASAPGDRHALPTAILADLLRVSGLRVTDLGADTPAEEIAAATAREDRLIAVGLCATTNLDRRTRRDLTRTVDLVHQVADVPVLLGGAAIGSWEQSRRLGADGWTAEAEDAVAWFGQLTRSSSPTGGAA